jgi:hypothetical protein
MGKNEIVLAKWTASRTKQANIVKNSVTKSCSFTHKDCTSIHVPKRPQ